MVVHEAAVHVNGRVGKDCQAFRPLPDSAISGHCPLS